MSILEAENKLSDHIFEKWHGLREAFDRADVDRSGSIERGEFVQLLSRFGLNLDDESLEALLRRFDKVRGVPNESAGRKVGVMTTTRPRMEIMKAGSQSTVVV